MTEHAKATFTVSNWQEDTLHEWEDGAKITRASIGYAYEGDMAGESSAECVFVYGPDGTATIVGFERFVGTIGDRTGSLVLESRGTYDGTTARGDLTVVDGSGTGDLEGATGTGTAESTSEPPGQATLDLG